MQTVWHRAISAERNHRASKFEKRNWPRFASSGPGPVWFNPSPGEPAGLGLEIEFHAQLHDARIAVELTVLNEGEVAFTKHSRSGCVVESIERSPAKLPVSRSLNLMFLKRDRSVRQKPWAANGARTTGANSSLRGIGIGEGAGIEPSAESFRRAGIGITHQIWPATYGRTGETTRTCGVNTTSKRYPSLSK